MPHWTVGELLLFQVLAGKSAARLKTERKNRDWGYLRGVLAKVDLLIGSKRFESRCRRSLSIVKTDVASHLGLLSEALRCVDYEINPKDLVTAMLTVAEQAKSDDQLAWDAVLAAHVSLDPLSRHTITPNKVKALWDKLCSTRVPRDGPPQQRAPFQDSSAAQVNYLQVDRVPGDAKYERIVENCIDINKDHTRAMHNHAAIYSDHEPGGHWKMWNRSKKRKEIHEASKHFIVTTGRGKIVGFALCKVNFKSLSILEIHVCNGFRRQGVGTRLFQLCVDAFKDKFKIVAAHVLADNIPGKDFLRTLGFYFPLANTNIQDMDRAAARAAQNLANRSAPRRAVPDSEGSATRHRRRRSSSLGPDHAGADSDDDRDSHVEHAQEYRPLATYQDHHPAAYESHAQTHNAQDRGSELELHQGRAGPRSVGMPQSPEPRAADRFPSSSSVPSPATRETDQGERRHQPSYASQHHSRKGLQLEHEQLRAQHEHRPLEPAELGNVNRHMGLESEDEHDHEHGHVHDHAHAHDHDHDHVHDQSALAIQTPNQGPQAHGGNNHQHRAQHGAQQDLPQIAETRVRLSQDRFPRFQHPLHSSFDAASPTKRADRSASLAHRDQAKGQQLQDQDEPSKRARRT